MREQLPCAQRWSKVTTPVWVVLIYSIKKQLLTNWTVSHLVVVFILPKFLIWWIFLLWICMQFDDCTVPMTVPKWKRTSNSRSRNTPVSHASRWEVLPTSVPIHLPVLQKMREKCRYCYTEKIENKTCILCNICGLDFETVFVKVHTEV